MSNHALLSPSAAHRWLNCPRAPRLEATLPAQTSEYAREGTLAHSVCEVTAKRHFKKLTKRNEYSTTLKKLKADPLWNDEMLQTADVYTEHLAANAMRFERAPYVAFEVKVSIKDYVPEAFGRCDCVMFGEDTLIITDYKHGKGVPVSAEQNPQMMLYALGALTLYRPLFGDAIRRIEIYIDQPRIGSYESWACTIEELLAWGEEIRPKAQMAFMGFGEFHAGPWCQFCRACGQCKAQAAQETSALDDFVGAVQNSPDLLTLEQMGDALTRGKNLLSWYKSLEKVALAKLLNGEQIPGYKVVEGKTNRAWSNQDKALDKLLESGVERALIYDSVPKSLAQIEKVLGYPKFDELVGEFVIKPQGKPALAPENDARKPYNTAAADFADVAKNGGGQSDVQ